MLSVIVVNFNTREYLRKCLNSLIIHEPGAQIIVVDNASKDGSVEMVRSDFPSVTLICEAENRGFAPANNIGLKVATGKYVVLFNSDAELRDAALSQCAAMMESDEKLGAVHPRLIGPDGLPQICEHRSPDLKSMFREMFRIDRIGNATGEMWLAGTALVIRKTALDSIGGGLDARYFMYWEDADLSARLRQAGWKLDICSTAEIKHYGGASGGGADNSRRADLHAWFCYGKHRWFRTNRPAWEAASVWCLDAFDVPRKYVRGLARKSRRKAEWAQAQVTMRVLGGLLIGQQPPRPVAAIKGKTI